MEKLNKNYWRPLWAGLVLDGEGKHFAAMKESVWLFLYLIFKANAKTGFLTKSYKEISWETKIKAKTIRNWAKRLRDKGYIATKKRGRGLLIYVKKWKTFKHPSASRETAPWRARSAGKSALLEADTPPSVGRRENKQTSEILSLKQKMRQVGVPNKDIKYINNVNKEKQNEFNPLFLSKDELLANDLASGLGDTGSLKFYLSLARKYPESLLRRTLSEVKDIPRNKIKRSKGAIFNYLIKNYE